MKCKKMGLGKNLDRCYHSQEIGSQESEDYLYATGISKDRETDNCKTKASMKFGCFGVAFHASYVVSLFMLCIWFLPFYSLIVFHMIPSQCKIPCPS